MARSMPGSVAVIDGASFVLPYDHELVRGLAGRGQAVSLFASRTRYNQNFLDALRGVPRVQVHERAVSGTVAPRWRGVLAYAALWAEVWRRRREFDVINLQFSVLWPLELLLGWLLRSRFVLTVHNAVPHDHGAQQHTPTRWLAGLARRLVFVSHATRADFLKRYGQHFAARSSVVPHGLLPLAPGLPAVPYAAGAAPQALVFWSSVRPYKGVELFVELARSPIWRERGLPLEVHGAWAPELHGLRDELRSLGVQVHDGFLDEAALQELLARPVLFVLPYREASQSGALYTLLHHGCVFVCSDVGDLGDFLRDNDLPELLLRERTVDAMLACLQAAQQQPLAVNRKLQAAQHRLQWSTLLALPDAQAAYGTAAQTHPQ